MAAQDADAEYGLPFLPLEVRCGRSSGTILMTPAGDFVFNPHPRRGGGPLSWIAQLLWSVKSQHVPAKQLLGAVLESPCAFRVVFAREVTSRTGCVAKHRFVIHSTQRFETTDTAAVSALVTHLRRTSSWWGRAHPPHIAAIVNPVSGRGTAARLLETQLLPLLRDAAGLRVTVHVTQCAKHATELVAGMKLNTAAAAAAAAGVESGLGGGSESLGEKAGREEQEGEGVDAVVFVGGDGTLHEGLQGLFARPDWEVARHVPFAAVPSGSGNGLAASCGLWDPATAVVALTRGRVERVDVASVLQPPGNRFYCLLSVVYGTMANLDIGTNHLRWMGELRFHLGGIWALIRGRCYDCRVFVLPPEAATARPPGASASITTTTATTSSSACGGGGCVAVTRPLGGPQSAAAGGGEGACGMEERLLPGSWGSEGDSVAGGEGGGLRLSEFPTGPPLPLLSQLPSLPHPLPDSPSALPPGWLKLPDSFAILGAYNTQFLALGARANPGGRMGDGTWEVWHLDAGADAGPAAGRGGRRAGRGVRARSLKVMLGVEDGSFAKTPGVMEVTQARALLFEPRDRATWTVLDGEEAPHRPLYLEVHPGLIAMLVAPGWEEQGL